ncbi:MAG: hypothetical protein L3K16_01530 [Thermoplasmata archaeon]|nr:hypothetical protein [Thermoplasmata archaeon]
MSDPSPEMATSLARNVLSKSLRVRKGEDVVIEAWSESLPWAKPFVVEARKMGANPMLLYEDEESFWAALAAGNGKSTGRVGQHEWATLANSAAYVFFFGPSEWPRADDLPAKNRAGVAAYNREWYQRSAKVKVRGARMYLGRTSQLSADRWKLDLDAWRDELVRASLVPPADMNRMGKRIGTRMQKGKRVTVSHPNGTDLSFRLARTPVQLDDGLVDDADLKLGQNMAAIPGGVVGICVDPASPNGTVTGNHVTYPDSGPVRGTHWEFSDGHLTEQSYEAGGEPILKAYAKAPKNGRDRLGYFSIGLNPEITNLPQMEDQELGAVLLQLGNNTFRGGTVKSPFGVWMVVKGATVSIDGKPVVQDGRVV